MYSYHHQHAHFFLIRRKLYLIQTKFKNRNAPKLLLSDRNLEDICEFLKPSLMHIILIIRRIAIAEFFSLAPSINIYASFRYTYSMVLNYCELFWPYFDLYLVTEILIWNTLMCIIYRFSQKDISYCGMLINGEWWYGKTP